MKKEMTCICCPLGCTLEVEIEDGRVLSVTGNSCPRGAKYAADEMTHPTRVLTSSVKVSNRNAWLSVKTAAPISKENLFAAMQKVKAATAAAPVNIGDVIVKDISDGVDLVATRKID